MPVQTTKCYKSFTHRHPTVTQCHIDRPRKNIVMAPITLIFILLANVNTEIDGAKETRLNQLLRTPPATIRTSETKPAATAGNNLNAGSQGQPLSSKASQEIRQISPLEDKKSKDKSDSFRSNEDGDVIKSLPMVWENCMETTFRENQEKYAKAQDMEIVVQHYPIENNKEISTSNTWNKRDAQHYNMSAARNAWIEKYNSLLNSRADERRQQKPDYVPVKKATLTTISEPETTEFTTSITTSTSTTKTPTLSQTVPSSSSNPITIHSTSTFEADVPIIPITREVFREEIELQNATDKNVIPSYTEDWFDMKKVEDKTIIRFSSLPQRTTYLIPTLRLDDGFHPFSFMSEFFYLIYPFEFPVGKLSSFEKA